MPLAEITLRNFTVFADARLDLCPGINVLIGANATGKTHAMKAAYALLRDRNKEALQTPDSPGTFGTLERVFRVDPHQISRLVRRGPLPGEGDTSVAVTGAGGGRIEVSIPAAGAKEVHRDAVMSPMNTLYIPSREVLSMFEGFIAAYQNRELSFDETFYDLCVALSAAPLRGPRAQHAAPLLLSLEAVLGGKVVLDGTRFYVQSPGGERFEAHLVAEGLRKLASLAHLVANGSIAPGGVLFWDEPETNLNPGLITRVTDILLALAREGVQVVLATHDYLLSHRLSLLGEYDQISPNMVRFFSLARERPDDPVTIAAGKTLADLPQNPILEEFARHYDFERSLFDTSHGG